MEAILQNAEKKLKNDADFSTLVSDFATSMSKLSIACRELLYDLSDEALQSAEDSIEKFKGVISTGIVDEDELTAVKQHIRKVNLNLLKEWKTFHQNKTSGVLSKLGTIGSLVQDEYKISQLTTNISNGNDWSNLSKVDDGIYTRLDLLISSINEVNQMEEKLNLSEEIKDFVILVTRGKAKVTDLNDTIINWIKEENLEDKFVVGFKK
jgi:hypothetical protein